MHTERMSRRNQAEGTVSVWAARAGGARLVAAERRHADELDRTSSSSFASTGLTLSSPCLRKCRLCKLSDIEFTRQKGNRVRDYAGHALGDSHLRSNGLRERRRVAIYRVRRMSSPTSTRSVFDKSPMIFLTGSGSFRTRVGIARI